MMKLRLFVGLVVILHSGFPGIASAKRPIIIAHRGASGYLPEHTLEAATLAHAQGADFIEQDVVLSKDRIPVVLHDIQIDTVTDVAKRFPERRRADGRYYAIDFTLAELKSLNVTERINPRSGQPVFSGRFPAGKSAFQIPTLEEELELIAGLNKSTGRKVGIYPEIKSAAWHRKEGAEISPIVLEVLARHGYKDHNDRCYLQSFEFNEVQRIRGEFGYKGRLIQLVAGRGGSGGIDFTSAGGLDQLVGLVDGIGPSLPLVVEDDGNKGFVATPLVRLAHERNLEVHPYTIRADALPEGVTNAAEMFRLCFDVAGVDGVFTDHPDQGVAFLKEQ